MKLRIIIMIFVAGLMVISSCTTNSTCIKEPSGTYLSEDGKYEKLVFTENNRVYLYKDSQNIIYSSFNMFDEDIVINTKPQISFEVLCDKTIVEKIGSKEIRYYKK
ncbi:MAG: hypothetical protein JXR58_03485 [Bacteroidales bacterium]|nr:hypothetical protein [Bacteroidales bacterium]